MNKRRIVAGLWVNNGYYAHGNRTQFDVACEGQWHLSPEEGPEAVADQINDLCLELNETSTGLLQQIVVARGHRLVREHGQDVVPGADGILRVRGHFAGFCPVPTDEYPGTEIGFELTDAVVVTNSPEHDPQTTRLPRALQPLLDTSSIFYLR